MSDMERNEINARAPSEVKYAIGRIANGMANLAIELVRLARQDYLFIGGAKHEEQRSPRHGLVVFNLERKS
jgi:hypothetical protein